MTYVTVIGDIMLDRWVVGSTNRLSPEAPVPVLLEQQVKTNLGGAGNLSANLSNLGVGVRLHGAIGNDESGVQITNLVDQHKNIQCKFKMQGITTTKTRFVDESGHHLMRWDQEQKTTDNRIEFAFEDIVVISDYNKGMVDRDVIKQAINASAKVFVDPKQGPEVYKGAYLVKPNLKEYKQWFGEFNRITALEKMREYQWTWLVVTMGSRGIYCLNVNGDHKCFSENVVGLADVSGAGDVVLSVLVYGHLNKMSMFDAAKKACYAAARSVERSGIAVVTHTDLKEQIVFANGCFDVIHAGHVKLLEYAKTLGDKLIVGLNSDASVKRLKGDSRPINNQDMRKYLLEKLSCVDEVIIFDEETPLNLIKQIKPSIIVKGGDYAPEQVVGYDIVDKVEIFPIEVGYSTTKIIEKMQ